MTAIIDSKNYATQFKKVTALLATIAMASVLHAAELTNQAVLSVEIAIDAAVRDNPGLAEMRSRYQAMAEIPSQAGALPDPVLSFAAMNLPMDTFNRDQEAMTQMQLGFSQLFPFPGKRGLREQAAEFEARAALSGKSTLSQGAAG